MRAAARSSHVQLDAARSIEGVRADDADPHSTHPKRWSMCQSSGCLEMPSARKLAHCLRHRRDPLCLGPRRYGNDRPKSMTVPHCDLAAQRLRAHGVARSTQTGAARTVLVAIARGGGSRSHPHLSPPHLHPIPLPLRSRSARSASTPPFSFAATSGGGRSTALVAKDSHP